MVSTCKNPADTLSTNELVWLAGLLEGEGCFDLRYGGGRSRRTKGIKLPSVTLLMTDEDVVARVSEMFQRKYHGSHRPAMPNHHKRRFEVRVTGRAAENIMLAILPYMFSRRSAKIKEILSQYSSSEEFDRRSNAQKKRWAKTNKNRPVNLCSESDCSRVVKARGLCDMHYLRVVRKERLEKESE